jgi:hypothetical protein
VADARFNETQCRVVEAAYKSGDFFLHGCSSVAGKQVMGFCRLPHSAGQSKAGHAAF